MISGTFTFEFTYLILVRDNMLAHAVFLLFNNLYNPDVWLPIVNKITTFFLLHAKHIGNLLDMKYCTMNNISTTFIMYVYVKSGIQIIT